MAASADPRVAFQSIANELLDLIGGTKVTMELTRATTSSVDAYRAYLAGVQALNGWRLGEADSLLKSATTIDTTFALAYYKRALTLGWINALDRSEHVYTSQKAVDYKSRLPQRLQEIVVANNDLAKAFMANGPEAGALFRAARARSAPLVQRDSLDAEAWYGLADAQFHEATQTGINNVDSIVGLLNQLQRGFKRAIAIDSTNHLAYQHLVGIYSMAAAGELIPSSSMAIRCAAWARRRRCVRSRRPGWWSCATRPRPAIAMQLPGGWPPIRMPTRPGAR